MRQRGSGSLVPHQAVGAVGGPPHGSRALPIWAQEWAAIPQGGWLPRLHPASLGAAGGKAWKPSHTRVGEGGREGLAHAGLGTQARPHSLPAGGR